MKSDMNYAFQNKFLSVYYSIMPYLIENQIQTVMD